MNFMLKLLFSHLQKMLQTEKEGYKQMQQSMESQRHPTGKIVLVTWMLQELLCTCTSMHVVFTCTCIFHVTCGKLGRFLVMFHTLNITLTCTKLERIQYCYMHVTPMPHACDHCDIRMPQYCSLLWHNMIH